MSPDNLCLVLRLLSFLIPISAISPASLQASLEASNSNIKPNATAGTPPDGSHSSSLRNPDDLLAGFFNLTAMPPPRYDYRDGIYEVSMFRSTTGSKHRTVRDPGLSVFNWKSALSAFASGINAAQERTHSNIDDNIPGNRFEIKVPVAKRATWHRTRPRKVAFQIIVQEEDPKLTFREVRIVLDGLKSYGEQFMTGSNKDQIRMCRFSLYVKEPDALVANGTVSIEVPPSPSDVPTLSSFLESSPPSAYS